MVSPTAFINSCPSYYDPKKDAWMERLASIMRSFPFDYTRRLFA